MTDIRDPLDPIARWRALIDAVEGIALAATDAPEIDPAEAKEVRRLITMRLAARRNSLPAAWTGRPGIVPRLVPDPRANAAPPDRSEPGPAGSAPACAPSAGLARVGRNATGSGQPRTAK
jgi:hypothetical protein